MLRHRFGLAVALVAMVACGQSPREANAAGEVAATAQAPVESGIAQSDDLAAIEALVAAGHPWRATLQLAPILRDTKRRTPAAVLLAARAAVGWEGWTEVEKLLTGQSWLDSSFAGEGHALLARAALERGADSVALPHAITAVASAPDAATRATRLVILARALDRRNAADSAAATYMRAAESLRPIADWLRLRAAGTEADSARRAATFARVSLAPARARVAWTEAQARERFSDPLGAAARYAALGATVQALRLRLTAAPEGAARDIARRELVAFVGSKSGTADAKLAVEVLDRAFPSLAPAEELVVARSAAVNGPPARAASAFSRATALLTPADRLQYGQLLARLGRAREGAAQFDLVQGPLAGQAAYQRARTGDAAVKRSALRDVATRFAADTGAATSALYLLADLAVDDGDDAQARAAYQEIYAKYPTSTRAGDARFAAAIIALAGGSARSAAIELDSLVTATPKSDEVLAAKYWSGRAWSAAGDATTARARWRQAATDQPNSYYAAASARRLGETPWVPAARADSFPRVAAVDSAIARADLLERLGMDTEARFEYDALEEAAATSRDRLLATAGALRGHDEPTRAMRLGRKLVDLGEKDARAYRLLYPLPDRDQLVGVAKARDIDPALVAALIRQESSFNPRAVSVAGARGLMQVLPAVGEEIARNLRYPVWYPVLLFDADANMDIGTAHLAGTLKQYGPLPRVLAAYNAGGARLTRWITRKGVGDAELFTERIPFVETRDYVRIVARNMEVYGSLYPRELAAGR